MTVAGQRKLQRSIHLLTGALLLAYVYLPAHGGFQTAIRAVAFPVLVATGIAMWQAPRIRRVRRQRQRAAGTVPS